MSGGSHTRCRPAVRRYPISDTSCQCCDHSPKMRKRSTCRHKKAAKPTRRTLHDQFINTNVDLFLLGIFFAYTSSVASQIFDDEENGEGSVSALSSYYYDEDDIEESNSDPVYAILFPFFTQTLAIIIYYIISRHLKILPYTAIVFLMGTIIGYVTNNRQENAVAYSANIWLGINGQVILLVFLPGLIFHDSYTINVHLFFQAFWQLIIFAFPMVLGGTALTALVAGNILPYSWSTSFCFIFGAILSGTDPIAVQSLLASAGAPHRLNMHISGESLLNDGSVVVLFNIFSSLFFYELNIPAGFGTFSVGEGFVYFFRLALGGCAIGFAFGLGTVMMLKMLNRRLSEEENVVQVVLTVSSAYLAYFTSEILCLCSGIMATIACGITVKVLGETFINDHALTLHFWQVTAELLNTLLFVLGGLLWGDLLSDETFTAKAEDWGYLALLFVILIAIRFLLVFGLYPVTTRIGIGTNWKESVFMSFGGFRGSVGIALALSLEAQVYNNTNSTEDEDIRRSTDQLFFMVGGISVFTLLINGVLAGPLLSSLGLAATEKTRQAVIDNYEQQMVKNTLQAYVRLLSQERWKGVDHSTIQTHVPFLDSFSFDDLMVAVERHKNSTPVNEYVTPRLERVFPYLSDDLENGAIMSLRSKSFELLFSKSHSYERLVTLESCSPSPGGRRKMKSIRNLGEVLDAVQPGNEEEHGIEDKSDDINEVRLNYIEILRSSYYHQIENGSLEEFGDLPYSLFQGLDFCEDSCANKGQPLNDWEATRVASDTRVVLANRIFVMLLRKFKQLWKREKKLGPEDLFLDPKNFKIRFLVRQVLSFVRAHRHAQQVFQEYFTTTPGTLSAAEAKVIDESKAQVKLSESALDDIDQKVVLAVKGHLLSLILLNKSVQYVEQLSRKNLIPEAAATQLLEVLDGHVETVWLCSQLAHNGRLSTSTQIKKLEQLPTHIMEEFSIWEAIEDMRRSTTQRGGLKDSRMPFSRSSQSMRMNRSSSVGDHQSIFRSSTSASLGNTSSAIQTVDVSLSNTEDDVNQAPSFLSDDETPQSTGIRIPKIPSLGLPSLQRSPTGNTDGSESGPITF